MASWAKLGMWSVAAVLVSALSGGCGSDDEGSGNDSSDITSGKTCGGFAGILCPVGFTCQLSGNHPDASGHCVEDTSPDEGAGGNEDDTSDGPEGQFCGGIAGIQCDDGYECQFSGNHPDAGGTCVKSEDGGDPTEPSDEVNAAARDDYYARYIDGSEIESDLKEVAYEDVPVSVQKVYDYWQKEYEESESVAYKFPFKSEGETLDYLVVSNTDPNANTDWHAFFSPTGKCLGAIDLFVNEWTDCP